MENLNNRNNSTNTETEFVAVDQQNPNADFEMIIEDRSPEILHGNRNKLLEVLGGNRNSMYLDGNQLVHITENNEPNLQNNNFDVKNTPNAQNAQNTPNTPNTPNTSNTPNTQNTQDTQNNKKGNAKNHHGCCLQ